MSDDKAWREASNDERLVWVLADIRDALERIAAAMEGTA